MKKNDIKKIEELRKNAKNFDDEMNYITKHAKLKIAKSILLIPYVAITGSLTVLYVKTNIIDDIHKQKELKEIATEMSAYIKLCAINDGARQVGDKCLEYTMFAGGHVEISNIENAYLEMTKDIVPERDSMQYYTEGGALYRYIYNTTKKITEDLAEWKNCDVLDILNSYKYGYGNTDRLVNDYFGELKLPTFDQYVKDAPRNAKGEVIENFYQEMVQIGAESYVNSILPSKNNQITDLVK